MENFQLVLSVLGVIAIVAVLVHGFWSIRKQQPKPLRDGPSNRSKEPGMNRDREGFDADGIGQVRVVKQNSDSAEDDSEDFAAATPRHEHKEPVMSRSRQEPVLGAEATEPQIKSSGEQASLFAEDDLQNESLERVDSHQHTETRRTDDDHQSADTHQSIEAHHQDEQQTAVEPQAQQAQLDMSQSDTESQEAPLGDPVDVLVLHVCAKEGEELQGAELLPCMLTLNLKFGDMNIFHRHEDNAGTGKVLFSVANMVKPGTFDPDNMEQFATQGIVMFMTLPCHGDALRNFSIMLNSACQLADDLGAEVLDDRRQPWANETKQAYLDRIRAAVQ